PERLAQRDAHVFRRMVIVDMGIAHCLYREIEPAVLRERGQHMIQKSDAGRDAAGAGSVQIDIDDDLCLLSISLHTLLSSHLMVSFKPNSLTRRPRRDSAPGCQ